MNLKERILWVGGRVFHLVPAGMPVTIPTGINKGFRWVRGAANAPEWMGVYETSRQDAVSRFDLMGRTVFEVGANACFEILQFHGYRIENFDGEVVAAPQAVSDEIPATSA